MADIPIIDEEYRDLFVKTIVEKAELEPNDMHIAYHEFDAHKEAVGEEFVGDPQFEALECLSYWTA
ncbi:hypothetical protein ACXWTF_12750 [Thiomicrolovo sp. ZZH C-3]